MSDDWEEFMDNRDGLEQKVYHFYWDKFHLYLIKDAEGNILAGTGPKSWDELYHNPGLRRERKKKLDDLHKVRVQARKEKNAGEAQIVFHELNKIPLHKAQKAKI